MNPSDPVPSVLSPGFLNPGYVYAPYIPMSQRTYALNFYKTQPWDSLGEFWFRWHNPDYVGCPQPFPEPGDLVFRQLGGACVVALVLEANPAGLPIGVEETQNLNQDESRHSVYEVGFRNLQVVSLEHGGLWYTTLGRSSDRV